MPAVVLIIAGGGWILLQIIRNNTDNTILWLIGTAQISLNIL